MKDKKSQNLLIEDYITLITCIKEFSHNVRKQTFCHERSERISISLRIRAGWSEPSLDAFWIAKDEEFFLHADKEDSDQTARVRRLIWVFSGCTFQNNRFLMLIFISFLSKSELSNRTSMFLLRNNTTTRSNNKLTV